MRFQHLAEPTDPLIRSALESGEVDRVVVASHDDPIALRLALVVCHVGPDVPILVTIFDHEVADHLRATVPNVRVLSMADLVVPALAGPCLDPELVSVMCADEGEPDGVRADGDAAPRRVPATWPTDGAWSRYRGNIGSLVKPFDRSARILVAGLAGVAGLLVLDTIVTLLVEDVSFVEALYSVAKVVVTVGPSDVADNGPAWFQVFSVLVMLATLGFAAVLTAGLVNRLLDRRLTGIVGRRAVPRRDHVIVVGLGQVGLRLVELLREVEVPVVAIELDEDANNVGRARARRLPVVIGNGSSHSLLQRVSIEHAHGLVAVTSDEVENIAIAVAARALHRDLPTVVRAGDGEPDSETTSLAGIGTVVDIYRIAGHALAAAVLGADLNSVFAVADKTYLVYKGEISQTP